MNIKVHVLIASNCTSLTHRLKGLVVYKCYILLILHKYKSRCVVLNRTLLQQQGIGVPSFVLALFGTAVVVVAPSSPDMFYNKVASHKCTHWKLCFITTQLILPESSAINELKTNQVEARIRRPRRGEREHMVADWAEAYGRWIVYLRR